MSGPNATLNEKWFHYTVGKISNFLEKILFLTGIQTWDPFLRDPGSNPTKGNIFSCLKKCHFFLLCNRSSSPVPKVWKFTLSSASSSAKMQRGHFINQQNPFFRKLREDFSVEEAAFCYFLAFGAVFED